MTPLPDTLSPFHTNHPASSAYRITMSPHEWTWTQSEQEEMARALVQLDADRVRLKHQLEAANVKFGGSGITESMFDWILLNIPKGKHILELGSGHVSTRFLSKHYVMTSVENDHEFINLYKSTYIYAHLVDGWYSLDVLRAQLPLDYDLIIVDGPVGSEPRTGFLKHLNLFRQDVPIIVDDVWREAERNMAVALSAKLGRTLSMGTTSEWALSMGTTSEWAVIMPA